MFCWAFTKKMPGFQDVIAWPFSYPILFREGDDEDMGEDGPSLPPPLLHCMSGVFGGGGGGGGERIAAPAEKIPRPHKKSHINNRCSISRIIIFKLMDRRSDARIFLAKNVQALLFRISLKHYKLSPPPQWDRGGGYCGRTAGG